MRNSFTFGILILLGLLYKAACDTRYECIVNMRAAATGGMGGPGFGGDDDFEMDDMDEVGENGGAAMLGAMTATGSLTCPLGNRGSILVKRVAYGASMMSTTCKSDGMCPEEFDTADTVSERCDGRASCYVDMLRPVFLKCGRMSSYMTIEYECIDSWATFEICETVSTVARGASIFLTSSGYLSNKPPGSTRGTQMCECIIQSQNKADLYLDYLQTQLSTDQGQCPYEYVMIESKGNINQTAIDKELEQCGRRHVGNRWFKGSVRITYASGGPMQKKGLLAKFTADNRGTSPKIEIECGKIDSTTLKLKEKPPPLAESQAGSVTRTAIPKSNNPWQPPGMPPFPGAAPGLMPPGMPPMPPGMNMRAMFGMGMGGDMFDDASERMIPPFAHFPPTMFPNMFGNNAQPALPPRVAPPTGPSARGPPSARALDFSNWKINLPKTTPKKPRPTSGSVKKVSTRPVPKTTRKVRAKTRNRGRKPAKKTKAGQVMNEKKTPIDETTNNVKKKGNGSLVGLLFGGIGAVLIMGSVGILVINNYRKRQRIKREEAEYMYARNISISGGSASQTYGQGWKKGEESVYATVGDVESNRDVCVNPSVNVNPSIAVNPSVGGSTTEEDSVGKSADVLDNGNKKNANKNAKNDTDKSKKESPKEVTEAETETLSTGHRKGIPNESFVYDGPAQCTSSTVSKPNTPVKHVSVIEVHQSYDEDIKGTDEAVQAGLHTDECLDMCGYATVKKDEDQDVNHCSECNIVRPPRKKDYDNNFGIKKKCDN